jgi:murein DD-endopeptidase MepM/ murein hydrolase activator NlpD
MPMGSEVLAVRAGEVVELREHWSDETLSPYIHTRQDGVLVEMGDYVAQGDLLGWSGSSGTVAPHIHFQACLRGGQGSTGINEVTLPVNSATPRVRSTPREAWSAARPMPQDRAAGPAPHQRALHC